MGEITKQRDRAHVAVKFDYVLLICGFFASITKEPYSTTLSMMALMSFWNVISGLNDMFQSAMDPNSGCKLHVLNLKAARFFTVLGWSAFPLVFFGLKFKLLSYPQSEMLFCIADIFAKVVVTIILINATVEQSQQEKVDDLTQLADGLQKELTNSDRLLEKMMPKEVMDQLKSGQVPGSKEYNSVSVFFSDITNFTVMSSQSTTKQMIQTLTKLWQEYDKIAMKHAMYKVETIGDAYLGIVGCPEYLPDHAEKAVDFALDIITMIQSFKTAIGTSIRIRIGVASGSVTAGILGEMNPHW